MLASICVKLFVSLVALCVFGGALVCWLYYKQAKDLEESYEQDDLAARILAQWRVCKTTLKNTAAGCIERCLTDQKARQKAPQKNSIMENEMAGEQRRP